MIDISIAERIKALRTQLGLSQTAFGEPLGLTQAAIASYECGRRTPLDAVINNICHEYSVSAEWLRTGEGVMLAPQTKLDEIFSFVGKISNMPNDIRFRTAYVLSQLTADDWVRLGQIAEMIAGWDLDPDTGNKKSPDTD